MQTETKILAVARNVGASPCAALLILYDIEAYEVYKKY